MRLKRQWFRPGRRIERIANLYAAPFFSRRRKTSAAGVPSSSTRDDARRPRLVAIAESVGALFSITISLVLLVAILAGVLAFAKELRREALFLDPIDVPDDLVKRGYSPAVVSERILDRLRSIQRIASTSKPRQGIDDTSAEIDIQIPVGAVSMKSLARYARSMLDLPETRVFGEITHDADALRLVLRKRDRATVEIITEGLAATTLDDLVEQGAQAIVEATDPFVLASYFYIRDQPGENYDRTMKAIDYVLSHPPRTDDAWAWNLWGLVLERQHAADDAIAKYRRSIALDPSVSPAYVNLTSLLARAGRRDQARQVVEGLERMPNLSATTIARIGDMHRELIDGDKALAAYERALALEPANAPLRAQLGGMLWQLRRYDEAERVLRDASEHHPTLIAHLNFAGVLADRGDLPAARTELVLGRSLAQRPADQSAVDGFIALFDGHSAQAAELFARAVQQGAGDNPYVWWSWGRALAEQHQYAAAEERFRKAIDRYPAMSEAYAALGAALSAQGKTDAALATFAEGERVGPRYARLYLEWAMALKRADQPADATRLQAQAARLAAEERVKL